MRRVLIAFGIILLVFTVIWVFVLSDSFTERFTEDWTWEVNILGTTAFADEATGEFPDTPIEDDAINITERTIKVSDTNGDEVEFTDNYFTYDPATNAVIWEFEYSADVNAETVKHAEEAYQDDYFLFPANTEKTTYNIRNSSYQGVPLRFEKEEKVSGLTTYKFTYQDDMVNTVAYDWVELEEGQAVICFDFEMNFWVEPRTGEILKYREHCPGDYVVDADGERLYGLQRWGGETTGDDLIRRNKVIKDRLSALNFYNLYIPLALGGLGVIVLIIGLALPMLQKTENT